MNMVWKNLLYAGRRLQQNPGFALTAVLSLALGIGANIAIFSLVNAIVIQSRPLQAPEELVDIYIEQLYSEDREKAIQGLFTLVAVDDDRRPVPIRR